MGWWSSIENGTKVVGETISTAATWAWSWTYKPLVTTTTYVANTVVYLLKQGVALREAIPALAAPESMKILKAAAHITTHKIIPLIAINSLNGLLLSTVRDGRSDEAATLFDSTLLSATTLIDWAVWSYTARESAELVVETLALSTVGPAAFMAHKTALPLAHDDPCAQAKCTNKRILKGAFKQPLLILGNDLLTYAVSSLPHVGSPLSLILSVYFYGDYISRSANPHCERHRTTDSELLLALGLSYTATTMIMERFLAATVGMPPVLVGKTLNHLLLLWHINTAAHMDIPYVELGKGTITMDPIVAYEFMNSVITDIAFAGIMDKMAKIFHPEPNKTPIVSISWILKSLTNVLKSDLETENSPQPGFFKKAAHKALPPIFRSSKDAVHDPVLSIFWVDLQKLLVEILYHVRKYGGKLETLTNSNVPVVASAVKKILPQVLWAEYGISVKLSTFMLKLCREEDFHEFLLAFKLWLDRHKVQEKQELAPVRPNQLTNLHEGKSQALFTPLSEIEKTFIEVSRHPATPKTQRVNVDMSTPQARETAEKVEVHPMSLFNPEAHKKWTKRLSINSDSQSPSQNVNDPRLK